MQFFSQKVALLQCASLHAQHCMGGALQLVSSHAVLTSVRTLMPVGMVVAQILVLWPKYPRKLFGCRSSGMKLQPAQCSGQRSDSSLGGVHPIVRDCNCGQHGLLRIEIQ